VAVEGEAEIARGQYLWQTARAFCHSLSPEAFVSRFFLLSLFALFVGLTVAAPRPALAVNCNLNACITECSKRAGATPGAGCNSWCLQTMEERKAKGQCKK
jgi:hypothetical protein